MIHTDPAITSKDDKKPESERDDIVRVIGPAAEMQKEDEVDADLRKGEHDQARPPRPAPTADWSATRRTT